MSSRPISLNVRVGVARPPHAPLVVVEQEDERRRVAAQLHDEIGQSVTALVLELELERSIREAPEIRRAALLRSRDIAAQLLEDVRRLARSLRPEVLDELGLGPALRNLCDRLSAQTGLEIKHSLRDELPLLGPDLQLVIYRVTQESLTNVVRHAQARRADVAPACSDGVVELEVADDGTGIGGAPARGGGIRGMRERALLVGGVLDVEPAAAGGTRVRLRVRVEVGSG